MVLTRTRQQIEQRICDTTSAHQVFDTPELLEHILLQMCADDVYFNRHVDDDITGVKTLLLSQRVNKTWKSTITGSVNLQRTLWYRSGDDDKPAHNPFLRMWISKDQRIISHIGLPAFRTYPNWGSYTKIKCSASMFSRQTTKLKNGSWHDMLIMKGTGDGGFKYEVSWYYSRVTERAWSDREWALYSPTGDLTVGELMEKVREKLREEGLLESLRYY